MCRQAKLAGADCIKFQHHLPDEEMLRDVPVAAKQDMPLYDFFEETRPDFEAAPGSDGILRENRDTVFVYPVQSEGRL